MAGYLTTHVLDTARGRPAEGLTVELYRLDGEARDLVTAMTTNADGRTDGPILPAEHFAHGHLRAGVPGRRLPEVLRPGRGGPRFLDAVPIRFGMAEEAHYHVPLLLSPYGYSTYRGS